MLATRMKIAKALIEKGVKADEHIYVREYYDRIAAAKAEAKEKADAKKKGAK